MDDTAPPWCSWLRHFSISAEIEPVSQQQGTGTGFRRDKPRGLWVSVEGGPDVRGWSDWCRSEEFDLGPNEFVVTLADDANLLVLEDPEAVLAFTHEYGVDEPEMPGSTWGIRWNEVAERWQGIVITPYHWSLRLHMGASWYYGWDCASGVIWDADAIASIAPADTRLTSPALGE